MGNSNGKPVVFTDQGKPVVHPFHLLRSPACRLLDRRTPLQRSCRASIVAPSWSGSLMTLLANSQPQPFPTAARGGKGRFWKGADRGA